MGNVHSYKQTKRNLIKIIVKINIIIAYKTNNSLLNIIGTTNKFDVTSKSGIRKIDTQIATNVM